MNLGIAKIQSAIEHTTLTRLIVKGLKIRLHREAGSIQKVLPVSKFTGGLHADYSWDTIHKEGEQNKVYR